MINRRLVWDLVKLQTSLSSLSVVLVIWKFAHILTATVSISGWGFKVYIRFAKWWGIGTYVWVGIINYLDLGRTICWTQCSRAQQEVRDVRRNLTPVTLCVEFHDDASSFRDTCFNSAAWPRFAPPLLSLIFSLFPTAIFHSSQSRSRLTNKNLEQQTRELSTNSNRSYIYQKSFLPLQMSFGQ